MQSAPISYEIGALVFLMSKTQIDGFIGRAAVRS